MLGLRKIKGINILKFEEKYKLPINNIFDISSLIKDKVLILKNNNLFIPEKYLFVSNEIILKLLDTYNLNWIKKYCIILIIVRRGLLWKKIII